MASDEPEQQVVKVFLHDRGEHVESLWAEPLGEADGRVLVRLVNIPYLFPRPTWGDVIACALGTPGFEDRLAWDRGGLDFERVGERIHADGGRRAMIVQYQCEGPTRLKELGRWLLLEQDVIAENCPEAQKEQGGLLYLAVPRARAPEQLLELLGGSQLGFRFQLLYPDEETAG